VVHGLAEMATNMSRVDVLAPSVTTEWLGAGTNYVIQTPSGTLYRVYIDAAADVVFVKSIDGGLTWSLSTGVHSGTVQAVAVWYDRWSNISAGLIHCAYTDTGSDDIFYRSIDTESSDSLSGEVTVFAGSTAIAGGALSITRARGGNLVVAGSIDAGNEDGAWESTDVGATWGSAIADPSEAGTTDQYLLLPGWNADNQDVMLIFWDASAEELSVKRYDDSGNSWAETSIATSMTDQTAATAFPHMAAVVDLANSRNIVIAWSAVDAANADLRCWIIDDTTITETTNVVLDGTDDQGLCALAINSTTGLLYAFYGGKSDGSETFGASINIYYKSSANAGTTWGSETRLTTVGAYIRQINCPPRFLDFLPAPPLVLWGYTTGVLTEARINMGLPISPRASYQIGVM